MMKTSPKVIFFGNERLATGVTTSAPALSALLASGFTVSAVVLNQDATTSRRNRQPEIAEIAENHNIPVFYPSRLKDISAKLKQINTDIGVLIAYGKIVPPEIIDIFPAGIINLHPSLLPKHRGPTPIESVILADETETGVSLMKLTPQMDAGPIYFQRTTSVPGQISKQALADQLLQIGSEMIVQHLSDIIDGKITPNPQIEADATYDGLLSKSNSQVDWIKPAHQIEREVRAYAGWPGSVTTIGPHPIILKQVDVVNTSGKPGNYLFTKNELLIYCGQDALKIHRLQPLNKKEMPIEAFLAGYPL